MKVTASRTSRAVVGTVLLLLAVGPVAAEWTKGLEAYRNKDYAAAIKEFEEVTQTNPDYAGAYYMMGICQSSQGKLSQALASLRKAVELDGANPSYQVALGQAQVQAKQYSDAYQTLKAVSMSALEAQHRSTYALLFAKAATEAGRAGEAVRVLETQTQADSKNSNLFAALGVAHRTTGDDAKAFRAFKKAFELDPKDASSGRNAVSTAIAVGRRAGAAQEKQRYYSEAGAIAERLAGVASTFEHLLLAGEAWMGGKDYSKALQWFDKAAAKQPQNSLVCFYRGQCYSSLDRYDSAITELQQALKIGAAGKLRKQVYTQLGYVYDKKKDYLRAADAYSEAGNSSKASEMRTKQEQYEQNQKARAEEEEFRRKVDALRLQIAELEKLGESEEVQQLRDQLAQLERVLAEMGK